MTAATEIRVHHGAAPGLGVDVTSTTLRLKRADDDLQDANDPVPIPDVGVNYSWRKSLKLVATTAPDNKITNLRFFTLGESLVSDIFVCAVRALESADEYSGSVLFLLHGEISSRSLARILARRLQWAEMLASSGVEATALEIAALRHRYGGHLRELFDELYEIFQDPEISNPWKEAHHGQM